MTFIIAFIKVGSGEVISQNNAFFCLILCFLLFWAQVKYKPFITNELNDLNLKSNFIMIITILLGLFSSMFQDITLQILLLILLLGLNIYFMMFFIKGYLQLKMVVTKKSKFFDIINKKLGRFWSKGIFLN